MSRPGSILGYLQRTLGPSRVTELTDGQLLERCRASRDSDAFDILMRRHAALVWGVCRRVACDAQDAEDAFQATFLVLLKKARVVAGLPSLASWLYRVAYHVSLKANTAAARRRRRERQVAAMATTMTPDESPWDEMRPVLDAELNRLPEKYRAPLVLCYLEGKTNEQAARELGCPAGSMSKKLARGRELLRERLAGRGVLCTGAALGTALVEHAAEAAPPSRLLADTARLADAVATSSGTIAGVASKPVADLTKGVLRTMFLSKLQGGLLSSAALLAAGLSVLAAQAPLAPQATEPPAAPAAEPALAAPQSARLDLTPQTFPAIHRLVRPQENEWRHLRVQWLTDVVAARKKAAAEDKPIVICYTGGAGYNEPLGVC